MCIFGDFLFFFLEKIKQDFQIYAILFRDFDFFGIIVVFEIWNESWPKNLKFWSQSLNEIWKFGSRICNEIWLQNFTQKLQWNLTPKFAIKFDSQIWPKNLQWNLTPKFAMKFDSKICNEIWLQNLTQKFAMKFDSKNLKWNLTQVI